MTYPNAGEIPKSVKGALVQLNEDSILKILLPNIVPFQYNPSQLDWNQEPWTGSGEEQSPRAGGNEQPFDLPKKFTGFKIMIDGRGDATDLTPLSMGAFPRLAALEKLTETSQGALGDLAQSAGDLLGSTDNASPTIPKRAPILLVLGPRIMLPVKLNSFSASETVHGPSYYPQYVEVTMELETIIPHFCGSERSLTEKIIEGAYQITRAQNDAAALMGQVYGLSQTANIVLPI